MELRQTGPTTQPAPGSLSPLQDETPEWVKHSCLGQGKNTEDTAVEETGGPCLILPRPPPPQHTHCPTPSPHPKLSQPFFQKGSRQTSSVLTLLKPILGSQSPQGPCSPAHKGERAEAISLCMCSRVQTPARAPTLPALSGESQPPPSSDAISRTAAQSHTRPPNTPMRVCACVCTHTHTQLLSHRLATDQPGLPTVFSASPPISDDPA